ncbi:alpha/beta hydrolase [Sorangium sp. So ce131]|uniref:alpha/beta hydrolase n=1 Tax=Sorangium sp. So ce131 TaxID=3133282 RepID=UPI003F5EAC9D
MRRFIRRALLILAACVPVWGASGPLVARGLTRRAAPPSPEPPPAGWEAVSLTAEDGLRLGGWLHRGDAGRACVLALHGNGSSRTGLRDVLDVLAEDGTCVLALSLRAHGDSDGDVNEFGWSAANDVRAGVKFLERELPERRRLVFGTSLGAAAALYAAKDVAGRVDGYLLESPYRDLETAVRNRLDMRLGPLAPAAFAVLWPWGSVALPIDPARLRPVDAARDLPSSTHVTPVLLLAGDADAHATLAEAQDIAKAVPGPVRLERFPGADHGHLQRSDPARYRAVLRTWIGEQRGGP